MMIYLVVFFVVFILLVFIWPSYLVYQRTGLNPFLFGKSNSVNDFAGNCMKWIIAIVFIRLMIGLFMPELALKLGKLEFFSQRYLTNTGWVMLHLGLIWSTIAVLQMGNSWRVGINTQLKTTLTHKGLFKISRNPSFLGMLVTLLAVFLIIPDAITFCSFVTAIIVLQVQVRLEEDYLTKTHGKRYLDYLNTVRRWI